MVKTKNAPMKNKEETKNKTLNFVSCAKCINQAATKNAFTEATSIATMMERAGGSPRYETPTVTMVKQSNVK